MIQLLAAFAFTVLSFYLGRLVPSVLLVIGAGLLFLGADAHGVPIALVAVVATVAVVAGTAAAKVGDLVKTPIGGIQR